MSPHRIAAHVARALGAALLVTGSAAAGTAVASTAPPARWKVQPGPAIRGILTGVAATSAGNAWAVGHTVTPGIDGRPLIEHWDGTTWRRQPGPRLPDGSELAGIAATSVRNA